MAELQSDHEESGTATSTGAHVDRGRGEHDGDRRDTSGGASRSDRLLRGDERSELRERWDALQGRFVDDPAEATRLADDLVRDTRDRVVRRWEQRQDELSGAWEGREDPSTEDLRTTLRRYRDMFEQLLGS